MGIEYYGMEYGNRRMVWSMEIEYDGMEHGNRRVQFSCHQTAAAKLIQLALLSPFSC